MAVFATRQTTLATHVVGHSWQAYPDYFSRVPKSILFETITACSVLSFRQLPKQANHGMPSVRVDQPAQFDSLREV
jgi:hypothetical protein